MNENTNDLRIRVQEKIVSGHNAGLRFKILERPGTVLTLPIFVSKFNQIENQTLSYLYVPPSTI